MNPDEWGPWIEHDGNGCPPDLIGKFVHVLFEWEDGRGDTELLAIITPLLASCPSWSAREYAGYGYHSHWDGVSHSSMGFVTRYRVRIPRALIELRRLVETLPVTEDA